MSNTAAGQVEGPKITVIDNLEESMTLISISDGRYILQFDPDSEEFWDKPGGYGFGDLRDIGDGALSGAFVSGITSGITIAMKDPGIPGIAYLGKKLLLFIQPLSIAVDYLGELLFQQ